MATRSSSRGVGRRSRWRILAADFGECNVKRQWQQQQQQQQQQASASLSWDLNGIQMRKFSSYTEAKKEAESRLEEVAEVQQRDEMEKWLRGLKMPAVAQPNSKVDMSPETAKIVTQAGFASFLLHCEGRIASFVGKAFYTIGPCGEELMGVLGAAARKDDAVALHYRHLAVQIARQLSSKEKTMDQICLDRARGYVCSTLDPVTGGHHCALGGGKYDFYVTSTLASQAPPAVGRAMGIKLANQLSPETSRFPKDAISIVSVGDGSVNNGMFMSAANLARYALHRNFKCPILFVISNNDICISLRGYGYLDRFVKSLGLPVFKASGSGDVSGLWSTTNEAIKTVRSKSKPAVLVVDDLPRRFGHAATDRQFAYLEEEEIKKACETDPMRDACIQLLEHGLVSSPDELVNWWNEIREIVESSFDKASEEPKITTREQVMTQNQAPLASVEKLGSKLSPLPEAIMSNRERERWNRKAQPMRVLMNQVFKEIMARDESVVYVGEDVRHGGYYRVTDDLAELYPTRIQDVPPDETSVLGIGMGYSQSGLVPIVEIPYAKYLDCAADLFFEAIITHWCTHGNQKDGLVIRLQGFDKGVFGGNFHTHNNIYLAPGLDVVCYSNGRDYVRGMRHAVFQAKEAGRVVMSVDSTNLLYRRALFDEGVDGDSHWLHTYPFDDDIADDASSSMLDFETVVAYPKGHDPTSYHYVSSEASCQHINEQDDQVQVILFSYGNGIPTCMRAAKSLFDSKGLNIMVVDCPKLGYVSQGMEAILKRYPRANLVFADICKAGQHPFGAVTYDLQQKGYFATGPNLRKWHCIAAPPTYNPLGCTVTFLNESDVESAIQHVLP